MTRTEIIRQAMSNPTVRALMERLNPDEKAQAEQFAAQLAELAEAAISKSSTVISNGEMPTRGVSDNKGG